MEHEKALGLKVRIKRLPLLYYFLYLLLMISQEQLAEYQKLRAKEGLPEISDMDALTEASALVNLISLVVEKNEGK